MPFCNRFTPDGFLAPALFFFFSALSFFSIPPTPLSPPGVRGLLALALWKGRFRTDVIRPPPPPFFFRLFFFFPLTLLHFTSILTLFSRSWAHRSPLSHPPFPTLQLLGIFQHSDGSPHQTGVSFFSPTLQFTRIIPTLFVRLPPETTLGALISPFPVSRRQVPTLIFFFPIKSFLKPRFFSDVLGSPPFSSQTCTCPLLSVPFLRSFSPRFGTGVSAGCVSQSPFLTPPHGAVVARWIILGAARGPPHLTPYA